MNRRDFLKKSTKGIAVIGAVGTGVTSLARELAVKENYPSAAHLIWDAAKKNPIPKFPSGGIAEKFYYSDEYVRAQIRNGIVPIEYRHVGNYTTSDELKMAGIAKKLEDAIERKLILNL